ncbi:MAG: hypothetical protein KIG85_09795 [Thiopseudomonas sp.]|nr:hypothetical protein [Thiopseudomonas sp.]
MRRFRKQTESAEFTWREPPRLKWRIKYFASICLFAFMGGLILGTLLKDPPVKPQLLQARVQGDALQLCFSSLPKAVVMSQQGAYAMLFAVEPSPAQQGVLHWANGQHARWHLQPRENGMQLGVVALQALEGSWSVNEADNRCVDVRVRLRDEGAV